MTAPLRSIALPRRAFLASAATAALVARAAPVAAQASTTIRVSQFYDRSDGRNVQPAFQAAIDAAGRSGSGRVLNDLGMRSAEMWCPPRRSNGRLADDGIPLVVRHPMEIDFAGLSITLKGPGGGSRAQAGRGAGKPWYGGWMYVVGNPRFTRISVRNVTVDGGFPGPFVRNDRANVSDKGFRIQDSRVQEVRLSGVELRNFGGEIYYIGGSGPDWQYLDNCHFHGSPQSAFNPGGSGRLQASNLQAGRAYQAAEIIGGKGHTYSNCRFYDAGNGGTSIFGGPSPGFRSGYPYWFALWDGRGERPWITFDDVTFERCRPLKLGAWMRGRLRAVDTTVNLALDQGHVRDIDLVVDSVCDRDTNYEAVALAGPQSLNEPVRRLPSEKVRPPSNLRFDVTCSRTAAARSAGRAHLCGYRLTGGLVDAGSLNLTLRGEARKVAEVLHKPAPGFRMPRVATAGFRALG